MYHSQRDKNDAIYHDNVKNVVARKEQLTSQELKNNIMIPMHNKGEETQSEIYRPDTGNYYFGTVIFLSIFKHI